MKTIFLAFLGVLVVVCGASQTQSAENPSAETPQTIEIIRKGAHVATKGSAQYFIPHVKHWHGASPTTAMTHLAIQEALDGNTVDWMEQVSDEQYGSPANGSRRPK